MLRRENKATWIELPLVVAGHGLGVLTIYYDRPRKFNDEMVERLRTFANQAAQAIQNAELYAGTYRALETRVAQLSVLAAIGRELTATLDLTVIFDLMLDYALATTGAQAGAVIVLPEREGDAPLLARDGYPEEVFEEDRLWTRGITAKVLRTGQTVRVDDVCDDSAYVALIPETCSQLSVPLLWRGAPRGAITLESEQIAAFDDDAADFVGQLATQVVLAVDNARLFGAAAEGRDRMRAILDTMRDALILIDRNQSVVLANPQVSLLGLDADRIAAQPLRSLLADPSLNLAARLGFADDAALLALSADLDGSSSYPAVSYVVEQNGNRAHIRRQTIRVPDAEGQPIGVLLMFHDETEEQELEQAREDFSRMVVHDLRSPLTAISSSVMLLAEIVPPDSEYGSAVAHTAGASQRAVRKLLNRVDSLLDISRMRSGVIPLETQAVDLATIIRNVEEELAPLAAHRQVTISIERPETVPELMLDSDKIERVLLNLVDNALKFSPSGGLIDVRVLPPSNEHICIEVADQGPGIPEADRDAIFNRFMQGKQQGSSRRGSGLGLAFCKLAVEAHSGQITLRDNPTGGSIFTVTLPVTEDG
jgi:PAS domain S-box-containing protein